MVARLEVTEKSFSFKIVFIKKIDMQSKWI